MAITDTTGKPAPETLRITLSKTSAGVCLGPGRDLLPGKTEDVATPIAVRLLGNGRATLAEEKGAAAAKTDTAGK